MVRPTICKNVGSEPGVTYFKPQGVPLRNLEEIGLSVEEFEAIRLCDLGMLDQSEASKRMGISQPTINRLLNSAHLKVAKALTEGKALRIEGGHYRIKK